MHPIARHFSPEARAEVRKAFANGAEGYNCGVYVIYAGCRRCPLAVALYVDKLADLDLPFSDQIAEAFGAPVTSWSYDAVGIQAEAVDFINNHTQTADLAVAAFSEEN